jgi:hypothetical protein
MGQESAEHGRRRVSRRFLTLGVLGMLATQQAVTPLHALEPKGKTVGSAKPQKVSTKSDAQPQTASGPGASANAPVKMVIKTISDGHSGTGPAGLAKTVNERVISTPDGPPDETLFDAIGLVVGPLEGKRAYFLTGTGRRKPGGRAVPQIWVSTGGPWSELELHGLPENIDGQIRGGYSQNGTTVFLGEIGGNETPQPFALTLSPNKHTHIQYLGDGPKPNDGRLPARERSIFGIDGTFYISIAGDRPLWSSKTGRNFQNLVEPGVSEAVRTDSQYLQIDGGAMVNGVLTFFGASPNHGGFIVQKGTVIPLKDQGEKFPLGFIRRGPSVWLQWSSAGLFGEDELVGDYWGESRRIAIDSKTLIFMGPGARLVSFPNDPIDRIDVTGSLIFPTRSDPKNVAMTRTVRPLVESGSAAWRLYGGNSDGGLAFLTWRLESAAFRIDFVSNTITPMTVEGLPKARASLAKNATAFAVNERTGVQLMTVETTERDVDGEFRINAIPPELFRIDGKGLPRKIVTPATFRNISGLDPYVDGFIAKTDTGYYFSKTGDTWSRLPGRRNQIPFVRPSGIVWINPPKGYNSTAYSIEWQGQDLAYPLGSAETLEGACFNGESVVLVSDRFLYRHDSKPAASIWTILDAPALRSDAAFLGCEVAKRSIALIAQVGSEDRMLPGTGPQVAILANDGNVISQYRSAPCGFEGGSTVADWSLSESGDLYLAETLEAGFERGNVQIRRISPDGTNYLLSTVSKHLAGYGLETVSNLQVVGSKLMFTGQRSDAAMAWQLDPKDGQAVRCQFE